MKIANIKFLPLPSTQPYPTLSPTLDGKSPICHPTDPLQSPESTQCTTAIAIFLIVDHLMGILEKRPLANCQYQIFSATPTLLPSLDGTSPLRNPTGPHQRPKSTQCTPAIARFPLVDYLVGIKGKCPLENRQYQVFSTPPTLSPSLEGTSPIRHPTGPHQRPKSTLRTPATARFPPNVIVLNAGYCRHPTHHQNSQSLFILTVDNKQLVTPKFFPIFLLAVSFSF